MRMVVCENAIEVEVLLLLSREKVVRRFKFYQNQKTIEEMNNMSIEEDGEELLDIALIGDNLYASDSNGRINVINI